MKKSLGGDSDGWVGNKPCARPNFTGRKEVRALVWRTCVCACVCACVRVCKCVCKDQGVFVQGGSVLCSRCVLIRPWRQEKVTRAICGQVMFCRLKAKLWFCVEVSRLYVGAGTEVQPNTLASACPCPLSTIKKCMSDVWYMLHRNQKQPVTI